MMRLGIFTELYPGETAITLPHALLISAVGFLLVFFILGGLALFVKAMGAGFSRVSARREKKHPALSPSAVPVPDAPETPLPENASAGTLTLTDVSEEEAAVIMAIVSHRSGIPLNRLQFESIRLLED